MEFVLRHPDDRSRTATLGHDPERGIFVEVVWNGVPVALDADAVEVGRDPVEEIVALLTDFGFVPPRALAELRAYLDTPTCWRGRRPPRRVRRVLAMVEALEASGAGGCRGPLEVPRAT